MAKLIKTDISNIAGKYYKGPKEIMLDHEVYKFSVGNNNFVAFMDWTDGKYKVWNIMEHFKMPKNPDALTIHTVQNDSPLKTGNTGYEVRYKSGEPGYDTLEQAKKYAMRDYKNLIDYLTSHNESIVSRIEKVLLKG